MNSFISILPLFKSLLVISHHAQIILLFCKKIYFCHSNQIKIDMFSADICMIIAFGRHFLSIFSIFPLEIEICSEYESSTGHAEILYFQFLSYSSHIIPYGLILIFVVHVLVILQQIPTQFPFGVGMCVIVCLCFGYKNTV